MYTVSDTTVEQELAMDIQWLLIQGPLSQGNLVNVKGVTGSLDFDPTTGEVITDVEIWRVKHRIQESLVIFCKVRVRVVIWTILVIVPMNLMMSNTKIKSVNRSSKKTASVTKKYRGSIFFVFWKLV